MKFSEIENEKTKRAKIALKASMFKNENLKKEAIKALDDCINKYELKAFSGTTLALKKFFISDNNVYKLIKMVETIGRKRTIICPVERLDRITHVGDIAESFIGVPV